MDVETLKAMSHTVKSSFLSSLRKGVECYNILSDDSLTTDQIAEKLDVSKSRVFAYRSALLKTGLIERRETKVTKEEPPEITELREKYNITRRVAYNLKNAMKHLNILSRSDLTAVSMQ